MNFFDAVNKRRSVRKFIPQPIPSELIDCAFDAALLAPNSSNTQTWDFYWVRNSEMKARLVKYCLNQSAARTAAELIVVTADPKKWRRSYQPLNDFVRSVNAPKMVLDYYRKLIPVVYRWGVLNSYAPLKWLIATFYGFFRPTMRGPHSKKELQLVACKSAALACENFVLAATAQGLDTCMMEGFDEFRVKRLLGLSLSARVVMVIGVGYGDIARGIWGPRFRLPKEDVLHILQ